MTELNEKFKQSFLESMADEYEESWFGLSQREKDMLFSEDPSQLKALLAKNPKFDVNSVYSKEFKETALHVARTEDKVEVLLNAGANPNAQDYLGRTPLHTHAADAYEEGSEICEMLLNVGADPTIKDNNGDTALQYAYRAVNKTTAEMIEYFLNKKLKTLA